MMMIIMIKVNNDIIRYAFITYNSPDEANQAVSQLHGTEPFGQTMKVKDCLKTYFLLFNF